MTVVSNGKALAACERCGKWVQLNKAMLGSLHFCISDCEKAGKHLAVRDEVRGHLWWKKVWAVCDSCHRENPVSGQSG